MIIEENVHLVLDFPSERLYYQPCFRVSLFFFLEPCGLQVEALISARVFLIPDHLVVGVLM